MAREDAGKDLNPGFIDRVASGLRYAATGQFLIRGVGPENFFGPQQPIQPIAQDRAAGRQWDYPTGNNLRIQPRSEEAIGFNTLRGLADGYDLMRLIIETRKDQVGAYEWEIVPKDPDVDADSMKARIAEATAFFEKPDRENDWPEWLRLIIEDLLVIDAICVYPRMNKGGKLHSLDLVDGATIKRLIDEDGRTPFAPSPAFQQVLKGITAADYTTEELIYMSRNKRTWKIYGYSPVEQVMMTVNIALRRQVSQLEWYTAGNIPEAIAQLPKDWPAQSVKDFQMWWDSLMEGNTAQRRKMKFIPNLEGILFPKAAVLKDEYDEWLARICCFAFSISPTPFIKQNNRATGQQAAETAKEEGLMPLLTWLQTKMSSLVALQYPDLTFKWKLQIKIDPLMQAQVDAVYLGGAGKPSVITPDEVRKKLGMDALTPAQKEELNPTPPEAPQGKIDPLTGLPYKEPVQPVHPGAAPAATPALGKPAAKAQPAEKLAKAQRQVTKVGKYVETHQPALQKAIAAVLRKRAKMIANALRHSKLLGKLAKADTDVVQQILDELDTAGVAAAVVGEVTPEMIKAFKEAGIKGVMQVSMDATPDIVNHLYEAALKYAEERSALLVKGIDDTTLTDLQDAIAKGVEDGLSAADLADSIEALGAFGDARAATIARTELAFAHVQGNVEGWKQSGEDVQKRSILGDLHNIDDECDECADAGAVAMDEDFVPGFDFPPYHPNCICDVVPILNNNGGEE